MKKKVVIIGSTGSIGRQTLEVINKHNDKYQVLAITADKNFELLAHQINSFNPEYAAIKNTHFIENLNILCNPQKTKISGGENALLDIAGLEQADIVVVATIGISGLMPTLKALEKGKIVALANKETLITGGTLVAEILKAKSGRIIPVDSEHSAIFQCLNGESPNYIDKIILTSSGGAFRNKNHAEIEHAKAIDALKHPTWNMGEKVTIDSATLMNKGFEVIEANFLFNVPYKDIQVTIHPQSVVHSFVVFKDSSVKAQLSLPDMRIPIQYALSYPERLVSNWQGFIPSKIGSLTFEEPDFEKFPCLKLCYDVGKAGKSYPVVLNAADEVLVDAFLKDKIMFYDIYNIMSNIIERHSPIEIMNIGDITEVDRWAKKETEDLILRKKI